MRISTLAVSVFALAVSVDASVHPLLGERVPTISAASPGHGFDKRQISISTGGLSTPPQCASTCNPVNGEIALGCPVTACCTTSFETQYYNCLECIGSALDTTNYAAAQSNLNMLYMTCVDMGFVLPQFLLPGQKGNHSSSGSASAPFATGSTSSSSTGSSGAISNKSPRVQVEIIGIAIFLMFLGLWR